MPEQKLTREFSICLLPTEDITNDIEALRKSLPSSPYRDDIPHITLLRGITTPSDISDDELTRNIEQVLSISDALPLSGHVNKIINKDSRLYNSSGLILLDSSQELLQYRQNVASHLRLHGYVVEAQELSNFIPHVTIRLGVPLTGPIKHRAEELFHGHTITFTRWLLFRLITEGNRRIMHRAWPIPS